MYLMESFNSELRAVELPTQNHGRTLRNDGRSVSNASETSKSVRASVPSPQLMALRVHLSGYNSNMDICWEGEVADDLRF
jgi:hypothetical protein